MVKMIEFSDRNYEAICLVHKFKNSSEISMINDKFEFRIDKKKTVRQLVHHIAQHFGLDVDSFYLIFNSYQTNSAFETTPLKKSKLVEQDDRLLLEIGLIFGVDFVNRFLLYDMNSFEDSDEAVCIIRNMADLKIYPLLVDKNVIVSQFYNKVLQLCEIEDCNTDKLVLMFNNGDKSLKININEDDTRLLWVIGVVYRCGVKNVFELFQKSSEDHSSYNINDKSCLPIQSQEKKMQSSRINYLNEGLDLSLVTKNHTLLPGSIKPGKSSCLQYDPSTEKTLIEYRGLVNQAMTCYLNSLLQGLFMTPEFRNALYYWQYNYYDVKKNASKSITFQLQQLFLMLQTSPMRCIETLNLTHSFGWDSGESLRQHDLQELCRIMFDAIEKELENTTHSNLINKIYQGKMLDYVKCLECGIENSKVSTFLDLTLPIRPFGRTEVYQHLTDALSGYIQPEILDGDNRYECSNCHKKCNAHKGMKFIQLPYILSVHLMRFDYDYASMNRIKLYDKVEFPQTLNLNSYISDQSCLDNAESLNEIFSEELFGPCNKCDNNNCTDTDTSPSLCDENENKGINFSQHENKKLGNSKTEPVGPYVYDLYAIMLHSGNATGGHYFAYIKDFKTNEWLCFNDQSVTKITMKDIEKSYGSKMPRKRPESSACAYMLMYRQIDKKKNRNAISPEEFPPHVKNLQHIIEMLDKMDKETRVIQRSMFRVPVILTNSMGRNLQSMLFECGKTTTLDHLHKMAIAHFKVTNPCQLVIYDKTFKKVDSDVVVNMNNFISEIIMYKPSYSFLIQLVDESPITPGYILIKLFMINVNGTDENVDVNYPVEIEMEKNNNIGDLCDLLHLKYKISTEMVLHFVVFIKKNLKILFVDRIIKCSSLHKNYIFVFIQPKLSQSILMEKIVRVISRFHYTIRLQFVLSSNDTGCNLTHEDNYWASYSQYVCSVDVSGANVDQNEDINLIESEKSMKKITEMDILTSEDEQKKVLKDNGFCVIGDISDTTFTFSKKYSFVIITSSTENNETCDVYVDKRMNVKELRKNMEPNINLPIDFVTLHIYKPDNSLELALPERTLLDLNDFDTIQISFGLPDDQFCVSIYSQLSKNLGALFTKLFEWVITVGTSVIDTKKQLLAKLKEAHNIDLPLKRFRMRKKRGNVLMKCYLNEDVWDENIDGEWDIAIIDLIDRSEYELDKTKHLIMVYHVKFNNYGSKPIVKSELEFVVDKELTTPVNIQLAQMVSIKLNISEDELELGFTEDFNYFSWRTKKTNWSFDLFDGNICITCQCRPKKCPLKMITIDNDKNVR